MISSPRNHCRDPHRHCDNVKLIHAVSRLLVLLILAGSGLSKAADTVVPIRILAFNDFHGHLQAPDDATTGGIVRLAEHIAQIRSLQPHTLVVSAGDLVGASPLVSALFHDEPTIEAMNLLGLDFNAVGNHEFDEGVDELMRLQAGGCHPDDAGHSCRGDAVGTPVPFEGAHFKFLAANTRFDVDGRPLLPAYGIRTFDGVQVAFIGVTLRETPTLVRADASAGVSFGDEADTVNALLPELRRRGVAAIVVLLHQGGKQSGPSAGVNINGCAGELSGSPLVDIVSRLDDAVDLVVSGHTHAPYVCHLVNKAGRHLLVTSAWAQGRVLTDINLEIDREKNRVTHIAARNILVENTNPPAVASTAKIARMVDSYASLAAPLAGRSLALIARPVYNRHDAHCNNPAGALIADAQLAATSAPFSGGAQLALMNPGGIRGAGLLTQQDGRQTSVTYAQAFALQPFGNHLLTVTLSGRQLKQVLEEQFPGCGGQSVQRPLSPSQGFHFTWDRHGPQCSKITAMRLNGVRIKPQEDYRVTVNDYIGAGGDGCRACRR